MTPIPTPLVGLPVVPQGLPEALDNAPSFGTPDLTANEKFSKSVLNEQMQAMMDALNPAIVPTEELSAMSQESQQERSSGNTDRADALDATVAAGTMANLAASPLFRVFVLIIIVKIILSILRKIPGVRGVPSFNKCLKDVLNGGSISFTTQSQFIKGWANLDGTSSNGQTSKAEILIGDDIESKLYTYSGSRKAIFYCDNVPGGQEHSVHILANSVLPVTYKDPTDPDNDETLNGIAISTQITSLCDGLAQPVQYGYRPELLFPSSAGRMVYVLNSTQLRNIPARKVSIEPFSGTTLQNSFCKIILRKLSNPNPAPGIGESPYLSGGTTKYDIAWSEIWSMDTSVSGQIDLHVIRIEWHPASWNVSLTTDAYKYTSIAASALYWGPYNQSDLDTGYMSGTPMWKVYRFETDTAEKLNAFLKFVACSYTNSIESAFNAMPTAHTEVAPPDTRAYRVQVTGGSYAAPFNATDSYGFGFMQTADGYVYGTQTLPTGSDLDPTVAYTYNDYAKERFFTFGSGSLESREDIDVGDGLTPPSTSYQPVILQSNPSVSVKAYTPCTYPPVSVDSKLRMLVDNDADKFLVMATFGCCYTEELWDRFVELKRIARSTRHFVRL